MHKGVVHYIDYGPDNCGYINAGGDLVFFCPKTLGVHLRVGDVVTFVSYKGKFEQAISIVDINCLLDRIAGGG